MPATRLVMRDEVTYILGNRTDLATKADAWVDRAYQFLTQLKELEFPQMFTTSTQVLGIGSRAYPLPLDFFSIYNVRNNTKNTVLVQVSPLEYDKLSTSSGNQPPDTYALFGANLNIHPGPDTTDTLQLRYRKVAANLTADSSVHVLEDIWDNVIVTQAAAFGCDYLNEIERAIHYRRMARNEVRALQPRISADLLDRNEAIAPIGGEIN